jgi:hydroxymethylpyrimidine/phosphomethylpyrimidine kinase
METFPIPRVLTVAGSDPSGGAGLQADLKAFAAFGTWGCAAVTALTAQNTRQVTGIHPVPAAFVREQLETLFADVAIDAVKVGMIGTRELAETVALELGPRRASLRAIVVDPVMVSKGGHSLVDDDAVAAIRDRLLPLATVLTPNRHEAARLLGREVGEDERSLREAAAALRTLGPEAVCVKGGASRGSLAIDAVATERGIHTLRTARIATQNLHGTGCTFSSAIAAILARGTEVDEAIFLAKGFIAESLATSGRLAVGGGHGPTHALHRIEPWTPDARTTPTVERRDSGHVSVEGISG